MPDLIGQSIGRYHILEQLGEGGMATVFKAYDTRLEREVAVKMLRIEQFSPILLQQVLQRFEREAKSLAKLSHPNIVNILDFGQYKKKPYLVMEYLSGGTLKGKLGQALSWQAATQILIPVAQGLAFAHEHGIIHRDVKPANILLKQTGMPVLTDFGIAKLLETADGQTLTASGVGIGTPEYMAPEQGMGAKSIDARADIYALGIVFYEMVVGRKPYTADTPMAVVLKQINDPLPRPTEFILDLPQSVENVLLKALAKQPEDRFQSMDAFIDALEGLIRESVTTSSIRVESAVSPPPTPLTQPAVTPVAESPTTVIDPPTATVVAPAVKKVTLPQKSWFSVGCWIPVAFIFLGIFLAGLWAVFGMLKGPTPVAAPASQTSAPAKSIPPSSPPTIKPTLIPSRTPLPRPTNTPGPTSLPGKVVVPIEKMTPGIPWLPTASDGIPGAFWIDFKVNQAPFDNLLVRKAFIAAIDREELANIVREKSTRTNIRPATNLLPPDILGRDLYEQVGIPFDPARAREYLTEAGYPNGKNFPAVTLFAGASELNISMSTAVLQMWADQLNIVVGVKYIEKDYYTVIKQDPPAIYVFGWVADINDPENFMQVFRPDYEQNITGFSNSQYVSLVDLAALSTDPARRQELYIIAERILCEEEAVIIPLYHFTNPSQ